jgi:tetratricopeptide (TPR) repeat protein
MDERKRRTVSFFILDGSSRLTKAWRTKLLLWCGLVALFFGVGFAIQVERFSGAAARLVSQGFDALYNLDYGAAISDFKQLIEISPSGPAGHIYLATAYWMQELNENNELDLDRFANDSIFGGGQKSERAGRNETAIETSINRAIAITEERLKADAKDQEALYYLGAAYGVMAGYQATVKKSGWKSFRNGNKSFKYHHELLKLNPHFYDAYITQGLYNYATSTLPLSVKILAYVFGYHGDKEVGLRQIQVAAAKGSYVNDDAWLTLATLYTREKRYAEAARILEKLSSKYPRNHLLELGCANLYLKLGKKAEAVALYRDILAKRNRGMPHFNTISAEKLQNRIREASGS